MMDQYYADMKGKFDKRNHNYWAQSPLSRLNIDYTAGDTYACYEIWKHFINYNKGMLRVKEDRADETSAMKAKEGVRRGGNIGTEARAEGPLKKFIWSCFMYILVFGTIVFYYSDPMHISTL